MSNAPSFPSRPVELSDTIYAHLRAIAQCQMNGERAGHTLTATALVHEALLRLSPTSGPTPASGDGGPPQGDLNFMRAAAEAMRRILIEHARARNRIKRGGRGEGEGPLRSRIDLEQIGEVADLALEEQSEAVLAFDDAFQRLDAHDPRFADVVRLRFYAGMTVPEVAMALGVSARTVNNDWAYARAWLARELQSHVGA